MNLLNIALVLLVSLLGSHDRYPVPLKKTTHLFYVQRTENTNTVVYEANFDDQGQLNAKDPIKIYWVLYEQGGTVEPLTRLENTFAFGVNHKAVKNQNHVYDIELVSFKKLKLRLRQTAPFQAEILKGEGQSASPLDHIFVHANDAGLWTKVEFLEIYTHLPDCKDLKQEKIQI